MSESLPHRYIVAIRYDQYESSFRTFYARKEAEAYYTEEAKKGYETHFGKLSIPKRKGSAI